MPTRTLPAQSAACLGTRTAHCHRLVATVDRYAPRTEHRAVVWAVTGLPPGVHTVRVEHTRTRGPAATDDTVVVDAFVVR